MKEGRLISSERENIENSDDKLIRPVRMEDYIGQEKVKEQMSIFIKAARNREEPLDHTLVFGPPGLGKTTLANELAPSLNMCRRIVDLVDTGRTLEANGLVEVEHISNVSSHLIINRAANKTRPKKIKKLLKMIKEAVNA